MDLNRLTEKAQDAIRQAQSLSQRHGHPQVDVEHLAIALLAQDGGVAARVLEKAGGDPGRAGPAPPAGSGAPAAGLGAEPARRPGLRGPAPQRRPERGPGRGRAHEGRVREHRAPPPGPGRPEGRRGGGGVPGRGPDAGQAARGDGGRPRRAAGDERHARGHVRGAREVRARPHRARPGRASSIPSSAATRRSGG